MQVIISEEEWKEYKGLKDSYQFFVDAKLLAEFECELSERMKENLLIVLPKLDIKTKVKWQKMNEVSKKNLLKDYEKIFPDFTKRKLK